MPITESLDALGDWVTCGKCGDEMKVKVNTEVFKPVTMTVMVRKWATCFGNMVQKLCGGEDLRSTQATDRKCSEILSRMQNNGREKCHYKHRK